jgi:hypothetical protein
MKLNWNLYPEEINKNEKEIFEDIQKFLKTSQGLEVIASSEELISRGIYPLNKGDCCIISNVTITRTKDEQRINTIEINLFVTSGNYPSLTFYELCMYPILKDFYKIFKVIEKV